jgi:hypothetical protein
VLAAERTARTEEVTPLGLITAVGTLLLARLVDDGELLLNEDVTVWATGMDLDKSTFGLLGLVLVEQPARCSMSDADRLGQSSQQRTRLGNEEKTRQDDKTDSPVDGNRDTPRTAPLATLK